jgi:hypothetical protein
MKKKKVNKRRRGMQKEKIKSEMQNIQKGYKKTGKKVTGINTDVSQ